MSSQNNGPAFSNPVANSYVAQLGYVADVQHGSDGLVRATFNKLPDETGVAVVVGQPNSVGVACVAEYGRTVVVTGASGTVEGIDYLGQPMQETVATGVEGAKAFKWVTSIPGGTAAWGAEIGLPYAMKSEADAGAVGTAADITDPATISTGDPRGTVTFTATPDGTDRIFTYTPYRPDTDPAPASMHGVRHFYPPSP